MRQFPSILLFLTIVSFLILQQDANAFKKRKSRILSIDTRCDGVNVISLDSNTGNIVQLFGFNLTRLATNFRIDLRIEAMDRGTNRIFYKLQNLDGCRYLSNRQMNSMFTRIYNEMIVNNTHFRCPIKPGTYYLRTFISGKTIPELHPDGTYQLIARLRVPIWESVPLEIVWKYRIESS